MKSGWRGLAGFLLSGALLWWVLRDVSLAAVWAELRRADAWLFFWSTFAATIIFPIRALRWRVILEPVAPNVPFGPLWRATAIGMMINNILPARAGEIARAFALTREVPKIPFATSIASLVVDRLFDAVVLLLLGLLAFMDPAFPSEATIAGQTLADWAVGGIALTLGLLFLVYLFVFFPQALIVAFGVISRRISPKLEERGKMALQRFSDGLSVMRSPRRFTLVFGWTLVHWLVGAVGTWLGFLAVGIDLPFSASLFVQTITGFGVALPSAPGFFGVFEAIAVVSLAVYGVSAALATSWAIGFHILTFIPITVIGAVYFVRLGMHFRDLKAAPDPR
ncbi:MAG TPA: lysylphosphatidylglycerol synthase transmembrane domain-containing protein [Gemmatimonadaceae bacterium]|nr:lysylphosphatidylglycerol synthase transmembrane domain-containing protein [Gemmatimonadaceae bacterium]